MEHENNVFTLSESECFGTPGWSTALGSNNRQDDEEEANHGGDTDNQKDDNLNGWDIRSDGAFVGVADGPGTI
jgi:hypothetical protein